MNYNIEINKLAIIFFVGICAIVGIFLNMENISAAAIGGLVGYLSKDYVTTPDNVVVSENETEIIDETKYEGA